MTYPARRQKGGYFPVEAGAPAPVVVRVKRRIHFSDVDPMGVLWHGRYAQLMEQANEELGLLCGLGYADFRRHRVLAPIVQFHVDYFAPVSLGTDVTITGRMIWTGAARMNIEYQIHNPDARLAAGGYTVQMFVDESGAPLLAPPAIQEECQRRWRAGEFGAHS